LAGLGIPWIATLDGDQEGQKYIRSIKARGFEDKFVADRCLIHAAGTLEDQLLADGLEGELRPILRALGHSDADTLDVAGLKRRLLDNKIPYAAELASRVVADRALAQQMPQIFREAVTNLRGLV
jgi:hypothetical protein